MAAPAVGIGTLRRLGELETGGDPVLSVYLGLDCTGSSSAATREHALERLMADTERRSVEADVGRLHAMLRCTPGLAYGTRSLALFSSAKGTAVAAVPLPSPVGPMAVIDTSPWLEPLAGIFSPGDHAVAVVDRCAARLFRGSSRMLVEFATVHDDCDRRRARRVTELLLRADRRRAFDQLVVVSPCELRPIVDAALQSDLRRRLTGLVELGLGEASAQEIARAVAERARPESVERCGRSDGRARAREGLTLLAR